MHGIFFNGDISQAHIDDIIREIYSGLYTPVIKAAQISSKGLLPLVVDAGANIGLTTAYFAAYAERVIAIEPCAAHVECLRELVRYNDLSNVEVVPMALTGGGQIDVPCMSVLYRAPNPTSHSLMDRSDGSPINVEHVEVMSLDWLIRDKEITGIDLLKLDVEGSESEVIDSFADCAILPRYVAGEWHRWTKYSMVHFEKRLQSFGYEVRWMGIAGAGVAESPTIFIAWQRGEEAPV